MLPNANYPCQIINPWVIPMNVIFKGQMNAIFNAITDFHCDAVIKNK